VFPGVLRDVAAYTRQMVHREVHLVYLVPRVLSQALTALRSGVCEHCH
jgi:hypothetical protein